MKFNYFFFIIIFNAYIVNVFASNPDTSKNDKAKTEIQYISISFFNNFRINPALTGIQGNPVFSLEAGIDKPLRTYGDFYRPQFYSFMFDAAMSKKKNFGAGLYINDYKGGAIQNLSIGLTASKNFNLIKYNSDSTFHKLRIGISFEYNILGFSFGGITTGDMIDPRYGFVYNTWEHMPCDLNKRYINFSAGLWYHNPILYCGFAVDNITQPNIALYTASIIPREFIISTGGKIKVSGKFSLHPLFNISIINGYKGKYNSYTPAVLCSYILKYNAGLSYMDLNKIGIHAGCVLAKHLTLLATCAFSTNTDIYPFGSLSYLGGKMHFDFKNK